MPRSPASTTFTTDVPGALGRILANAGYAARLVVERRDGAALTTHQVRALTALVATTARGESRRVGAAAPAGEELARQVEAALAASAAKPRRGKARAAPRPVAAREARVRTKPSARR